MFCPIASVRNPPDRFKQCVPDMSYVETYKGKKFFQGNIKAAKNKELLQKHNIRLIVNCSTHIENFFPSDFVYYNIKINDTPEEQFGVRLCDAARFIFDFISSNEGNVFIHCHAGISRSSTVTLTFMMVHMGKSLKMGFHNLKERRPIANPNPGFWQELKSLENHMCVGFCRAFDK